MAPPENELNEIWDTPAVKKLEQQVDVWVAQYHNNGQAAGALSKTRKRKSRPENNNNDEQQPNGEAKGPSPKKRGRPKAKEEGGEENATPQRKVGRPRKNSLPAITTTTSTSTSPPPAANNGDASAPPATSNGYTLPALPASHVPGMRRKKSASTGGSLASRKLVGFAPPKKSRHGHT